MRKIVAMLLLGLLLVFSGCSQQNEEVQSVPVDNQLTLDRVYIKLAYGISTDVTANYDSSADCTLSFSVADSEIIRVGQRGNTCTLTAIGFGETTLTATYGSNTATVPIEVVFEESKLGVVHVQSQSVGDTELTAILGQPLELHSVLRYGLQDIEDAVISYAVEDDSIGVVDPGSGLFTPIANGTTQVLVTAVWPQFANLPITARYTVTVAENLAGGLTDFVVDVEEGKEIVLLQLTDMQIIDPGQSRYPDRIGNTKSLTDADLESKCFSYIRRAVQKADPDLILITGDIIYGEFDDSGRITEKFITFMESLEIPWAPVFGNHDNETVKGVTWQCLQYANAEYCLFKRGSVTGNGNYTVGIRQGERLVKVIYMMDSNGCRNAYTYSYLTSFPAYNQGEKVKTEAGIAADQLQWLHTTAQRIDGALEYPVSKFLATHIPMQEFGLAAYAAGYQKSTADDNTYIIGDTVARQNGDFGTKRETISGLYYTKGLWEALKEYGFDGVFVGHDHRNTMSILYEGIRFTYGLKTGTFDYYEDVGATKITLEPDGTAFAVEHLYD